MMKREHYKKLIEAVEARSTNLHSDDHGPQHWRCVALTGIRLASQNRQASAKTAFLFGLFHDAMRENDHTDPDHGKRGAQLARELFAEGLWTFPGGYDTAVYLACETHTDVIRANNDMVGVCYDADRLNLWRVGIKPDSNYLHTKTAEGWIYATENLHWSSLTWDDVLDELEKCYDTHYTFSW